MHSLLGRLDSEMRQTLSVQLRDAVRDLAPIGPNDSALFLRWVDTYPDMLVLLAVQILWSQATESRLSQHSLERGAGVADDTGAMDKPVEGEAKASAKARVEEAKEVLRPGMSSRMGSSRSARSSSLATCEEL